jgi:succinate dehydrogenase flavin-adding protein (antitoxin of CptAB toxin-antitoxin module)
MMFTKTSIITTTLDATDNELFKWANLNFEFVADDDTLSMM